jgi:hypothetical protein
MDTDLETIDAAPPAVSPEATRPFIRPVVPADGPALHELLAASIPDVVPDRARWLARWQWQCWGNPYRGQRPAGCVLTDGDRILGHIGAVYVPLLVGGTRATGAIGVDYAIAPEAAAQGGLFMALELAQAFFKGCEDCLTMATTANDKTAAVFGRFGCRPVAWTKEFWRAPASLHQQIRSCQGGSSRLFRYVLRSNVGSLVMRLAAVGHRSVRRSPSLPMPRGCWLETTVPSLARDLGHLWQEVADAVAGGDSAAAVACSARLTIDRTQEYFDWRYAGHPERDHIRALVVRDSDGRPLGAAMVFREQRHDRDVVYIEDIIVLPGRRDVVRALLCAALRLACNHEAQFLVTSPGSRSLRDLFWELGFESRARNAPAAVIALTPGSSAAETCRLPDPPDDHIEFWHGMMF